MLGGEQRDIPIPIRVGPQARPGQKIQGVKFTRRSELESSTTLVVLRDNIDSFARRAITIHVAPHPLQIETEALLLVDELHIITAQ